MISISELLQADQVELHPKAPDLEAAVRETAKLLKDDVRVDDWRAMTDALQEAVTCLSDAGSDFSLCLPHARTDAVTSLAMSVSRYEPGLPEAKGGPAVRYVFCIAAPQAMESDYLRVAGLLVRIVKDPRSEAQLRKAKTPEEFVERLAFLEAQI